MSESKRKCEGCQKTTDKLHVTADDVFLCDECYVDLITGPGHAPDEVTPGYAIEDKDKKDIIGILQELKKLTIEQHVDTIDRLTEENKRLRDAIEIVGSCAECKKSNETLTERLATMIKAWDFIREEGLLVEIDCNVAEDDSRWGEDPKDPDNTTFCADKECSGVWIRNELVTTHSNTCIIKKADDILAAFLKEGE